MVEMPREGCLDMFRQPQIDNMLKKVFNQW